MCGICGVFGTGSAGAVPAMVAAMRHRGPDDSGVFDRPGVALGMTRLAVIDLSPAAHQPMSSADGTVWIVYNGETYNFARERAILEQRGHEFRSHSDTEVVLRLYLEHGDAFVERMRGMFAVAVLDLRSGPGRERLVLARDHLGIKPLLYAETHAGLVFASEMKALLASGVVAPQIDPQALWYLMTFGSVPQPLTLLRNVRMLLPGHRMVVEPGRQRIEAFWSLPGRDRGLRKLPYEEQVTAVRRALEESVAGQIVSDVPVGAFLSGGIDSAALVGLMATTTGATVKTFSIGFGSEGRDLDETDDAARVAGLMGTQHARIEVAGGDVRDRIGGFARALDQPSVDGLNSWLVSAFAAKHVTVAISGTGGDELFAGYPWFGAVAGGIAARRDPGSRGAAAIARLLGRLPPGLFPPGLAARGIERLAGPRSVPAAFSRQLQMMGLAHGCALLAPALRREVDLRMAEQVFAAADQGPGAGAGIISRLSVLCMGTYLQNQLLRDIDAVSMASSLEVRVPFLDVDVVETALSLPDAAKLPRPGMAVSGSYAQSGAKRVLIDAMSHVLPAEVAQQRKRGFTMPMGAWLRGPLAEMREELLAPQAVARRGLLDPQAVATVHRRFMQDDAPWSLVWMPMILELWCREVLDGAGRDSHRAA